MFYLQYQINSNCDLNSVDTNLNFKTPANKNAIKFRDKSGRTLLMHACRHNKDKNLIPNILNKADNYKIKLKSYINIEDNEHKTALHHAVIYGNKKAVEKLFLEGAILDTQDIEGKTPLHHAAINYNQFDSVDTEQKEILNLHLKIIKILVNAGADARIKDLDGKTVLHYAVISNNKDAVDFLIESPNIDIDAIDKEGNTPLLYAAKTNYKKEIIQTLLNHSRKLDCQNNFGKTALMYLLRIGDKEIEKTLKKSDRISRSSVNQLDQENKNLLMGMLKNEYPKEKKGILPSIVENTEDLNLQDVDGLTALHYAAMYNNKHAIKLLLRQGANQTIKDKKENTYLDYLEKAPSKKNRR